MMEWGVVKADGFPLFVKGLLVNEKALIGITKLKKTYGYARIIELLDSSEARKVPACPIAKGMRRLSAAAYVL